MKAKSNGIILEMSHEEATALYKMTGKVTINQLERMGLTLDEAENVQDIYDVLDQLFNVVPEEE
jgi:hypothetical protein